MLTRAAAGLLWLLHFLPLSVLAAIGHGLGGLVYPLAGRRRKIALTNLRLCFPELSETDRDLLARRHVRVLMRSLLERGLCWWASAGRIRRLVRVDGLERLRRVEGTPVILLVPHFLGLDLAATRLALEIDAVSIYSRQKNPVVDRLLYHGRTRFGDQRILSRQEGMRAVVKALKDGRPLYYLPDMDYGPREAIFVPFFGEPAATVPGVSRLARMTGAKVLPCIARMLPGGQGYVLDIQEPWQDFPGQSLEADTRRMNAQIEQWVREMPEQYYWVHRRFKTRPPGASPVY
jgi:KDO2-lipid IV(A) lauroyltransferase